MKGMTKVAGISKEDIKSEFGDDAHLFLDSEVICPEFSLCS